MRLSLLRKPEKKIIPEVNPVKTLADAISKPLAKKSKFTGNAKIKGATKCDLDGRPIYNLKEWKQQNPGEPYFDSKLERYMCLSLYNANVPFKTKVNFILQDAFVYQGKTVQRIEMYPDFLLEHNKMIIDTKGHRTKDFDLKLKMLKRVLLACGMGDYEIHLPSTQKECDDLIWRLKIHNQQYPPRTIS